MAPGDTVQYTLQIDNDGAGPSGNPLKIEDYLSAGFTYVSLDSVTVNGANAIGSTTVDSSNPDQPIFTVSQAINAGQSLVLKFTAQVGAAVSPGIYYNSFSVNHTDPVLGKPATIATGTEAPVQVGGAAIGDTIYRDWDDDGIQDPEDEGLPGVTVNLYASDGTTLLQTTTTDANGNYLFNGLVAGTYVVKVDGASVPTGYTLTGDPEGALDGQATVTLTDDEENFAIDFGYQPGGAGSIGDLVFEDVGNDGSYDSALGDAGITNVTVWLYEDTNGNGVIDPDDALIGTTSSDANGLYTFTNLAEGLNYIVDVDETDSDLAAYFSPSTYLVTTDDPHAVSNLTGAYNDADFGFFELVPSSIGDQVFIDNNNNGVYDAGDQLLPNVTVNLYKDTNGNSVIDPGEPLLQSTSSTITGTYTFDTLGPGNYIVDVDESDPNVPGGYFPSADEIAVSLGIGEDRTDVDFPFVQLISKEVDKAIANPGDTLYYTITVQYPGSELLSNTTVTDAVPAGTTFSSAGQGGTESGGIVTWTLGSNTAGVPGVGSISYLCPGGIVREGGCTEVTSNFNAADTYISEGSPDTNYDGDTMYTRVSSGADIERPLLSFDVSSIPSNATVLTATLSMRTFNDNSGIYTVDVKALTQSWTESGATWNTYDGGNNWASAGGDFGSTVYGSFTTPTGNNVTINVDLTPSLVQSWVDTPSSNKGIILDPDDTGTVHTSYRSGVTTLEVIYVTPDVTTQIIATQDAFIDKEKPTQVQTQGELHTRIDSNADKRKRSLLQFDLASNIPTGATLNSATFNINVESGQTTGQTVEVRALTTSWSDATATWNSPWTTAGGDFAATDYGSFVPAITGWHSTDVITLTQAWWDGSITNHGLILTPNETTFSNSDVKYRSMEDAGLEPYLEINYTAPVASVGSRNTLSASPSLVSDGDTIQVSMVLTTSETITDVTPSALTVTDTNGASATCGSASPATQDVISGTVATFTYTCTASAGAVPGSVTFQADATGALGDTFATATSNSVLVSPPLTFQVTVNGPPATVDVVENVAYIQDDSVIPSTPSDPTETALSASIGDFVWADLNGDGVQDPGEPGLAGVQVCATDGVDTFCDTTDANGNYRIYGLDTGTYTVTLNLDTVPENYQPTTPTSLEVTLTAGQQFSNADFGLRPPGTASIGDTIWLDADEDGVVDTGEDGLPGVTVNLYKDVNNDGVIDPGDVLMDTTTTSITGTYQFEGLYGGDYLVQVDETSVVTTSVGVTSTIGAAMDLVSGTNPHDVTLLDDQAYTNADFGYNWGGSIGDFVWFDDNQDTVQDVGETGVADVTVMLWEDTNGNGEVDGAEPIVGIVTTDATGHYTFTNLAPGDYIVDVDESTVPAPPSSPNAGEFGLMIPTTGNELPVNLGPNQDYLDADIGWVEGAIIGDTLFHDVNHNGIQNAGEPGLANITVKLYESDGVTLVATTVTDGDGKYEFIAAPGDYVVTYDTADPDLPADLTDTTTPTSINATVSAGQTFQDADFGLDHSGSVGDTVFNDANGNGLQDAGSPGLPGVTVYLYNITGTLLAVDVTDGSGNHLFEGLPDGTYTVTVDATTVPTGFIQTTDPDETGTCTTCDSSGTATVSGGGSDLTLDFGYQATVNTYSVSGTVWDDNGAGGGIAGNGTQDGTEPGLADIKVTVTYTDTNNEVFTVVVTTTATGAYTVTGIPEGSDISITVDETTLPSSAYVATTADTLTITNITANQTNQDFGYQEQLGSISGTVVKGDGNGLADPGETPIQGVTITLRYAGDDGFLGTTDDITSTTTTDASGNYAFTDLLPGLYQIVETNLVGYTSLADADGGNPDNISLSLGVGENKIDQDFEEALPAIEATKRDALLTDADLNGFPSPGDTLSYTVTITNSGGSPATGVTFSDIPDSNTTLVVGLVSTSQGTVTSGNTGTPPVTVDIGPINAGASVTISFQVTIDDPLPAGVSHVYNQGTVSSNELPTEPTDDPDTPLDDDPTETDVTAAPDILAYKTDTLFVDGDGDGIPEPGDTLLYQITIVNNGNGAATGVWFTDTVDSNTTLVAGSVQASPGVTVTSNTDPTVGVEIGTLPGGGGSVNISFKVTIDDPLPAGVSHVYNQGTVSSNELPTEPTDDPALGGTTDPTVTLVTASPDLSASKSDVLFVDADGDGGGSPGDTLLYQVTIINNGNQDATGVIFSDMPDAFTTLVTGTIQTSLGTVTSGNGATDTSVSVDVGTIPGGNSVTISFQVTINDPLPAGVNSVSNQGTVSSNQLADVVTDDPVVPGDTDATITPLTVTPLLTSTKSVTDENGENVEPGDVLLYTVVIRNPTGFGVNGATFIDDIPANTTYVAGSVTAPPGSTVFKETPTLEITDISVPGRGQVIITFRVQVDDPLPAGVTQIVNQGTVVFDSNGDGINDSSQQTDGDTTQPGEQPTVIPVTAGPNFSQTTKDVVLLDDADGNGAVSPDDTLRYTVVIPNTGDQGAAGVAFRDNIPTNTTYVAASVSATSGTASYNAVANRIEWSGDVPAGGSVTITFDVTVDSGITVGTVLSNQGTVYYDSETEPTDGDTSEPGDQPTDVVVGGRPEGVAIKSVEDVNGGNLVPGDELLYTIVMQNQSGFDVNDIEFVDSIPAHTTYVADSVSAPPGSTVVSQSPTLRITGIDVPAHGQVIITFRVTVVDPLPAGVTEIVNQGTVFYDSDGDGINDSSQQTDGDTTQPGEQPTVIPVTAGPNFSQTTKDVVLLDDADGNGAVSPDDTLRYTVVIPNTGDQDAAGVEFTDNIPANTTYVAASVSAPPGSTVVSESPTLRITGIDVPARGQVIITFDVTVDSGIVVGTVLSNQGTVFYDSDDDGVNDATEPTDGDTSEPGDQPTDVVVGGRPEGVAIKSVEDVNGGNLVPGDELLYTIVMQNQSGLDVNDIEFVDSIPANTTYVAGSVTSPPGSTVFSETPTLRIKGIDVPARGQVIITFRVTVDAPLPAGVTQIINQGTVFYDSDGDGINDSSQQTDGDTTQPGEQPTTTNLAGLIAGTVFNDLNGNGVQDAGELGIGGVTVDLYAPGTDGLLGTADDVLVATTTTATDGTYSFDTVTAGSYLVTETDPALYVSTTSNNVPVSVPADGSATVDFGDQQVGTVSGIVYNDLNGDGTQDPGEPGLVGVTVELIDPGTDGIIGTADDFVADTTTTAGDGSYTFTGITAGNYLVTETDPASYVSTTSNDVPISIAPGGAATANFGDQDTGTVSGTVFEDLNGDGIQDPGEPGIGDVTVILYSEGPDGLLGTADDIVEGTTTTDASGNYTFTGVVAGSYLVEETDPTDYVSTTSNDVPVSVPPGGAANAQFGDQAVGTVSGVVFSDLNGNGVQDPGEPGLGGVSVNLIDAGPDGILGTADDVTTTTTTAGDGSYTFTGVVPSNYAVQETDPDGFVSTTTNYVPISVGSGGAASANFGDQALGTVGGTVFDDLNGSGSQDPGEPGIGGVTVELNGYTATTAGDGSYLFTGVVAGSYLVTETDPTGYVSTSSNDVPISVPPGGAASADFGDQAVGTVSGVVFSDLNGNGVQDPGEPGLGGVSVYLIDAGPDGILGTADDVTTTTTTAGDGSYTFTGVVPSNYAVQETDPDGFVSTTTNYVPISVGSGGAATANFGDQALGTVGGTVFDDLNGNGTQDPGEPGIGGVTATLYSEGPDGLLGTADDVVEGTTTTAGDGSYLFTGVVAGSYLVTETDPTGYVSTSSNDVPVSVPPSGAASADFGDQAVGTVSGTVFSDLNGNGIQDPGEPGLGGVTVDLIDPGPDGILGTADDFVAATTTTAGDGSYTFTGVEPGNYAVQETDPDGFISTISDLVPISIGSGGAATANFGDQAVGTVSGTVFDDLNGNGTQDPGEPGIGGVTVELLDADGNVVATTTTSGNGSFIITGIVAGDYTVQETDPDGFVSKTPNTVPITVEPGGAETANFGDQAVGTVSGTVFNDLNGNGVQDPGEPGIGGVTVELLDADRNVVATTTTAGDGSYIFTGIVAGDYTIRETDPDGFVSTTPNTLPISVPPGGAETANFGDQAVGTVSGTVFNDLNGNGVQDPGESGIGGVTVELLDADGNVVATTTTTGNGSYIFTGVVPGDYTIQETDPDGFVSTTPNTVPISVPPGGAATANFGDRVAAPVPGLVIELPRIDLGDPFGTGVDDWDTRIQVQNVGDYETSAVVFFWPEYDVTCPPNDPGPMGHACMRLPYNGVWTLHNQIPDGAYSAIVYSVSADLFQEACADAPTSTESWKSWMEDYANTGKPLVATVDRWGTDPYGEYEISSSYIGIEDEEMVGPGPPYQYFAPYIMHGYNGLDTTITIQNSGDKCTSIWIYYKQEGNCESMTAQHIEQIAPGQAIRVGPGADADIAFSTAIARPWLGSAYVTANVPLGIIVDQLSHAPSANQGTLLTMRGMPYKQLYEYTWYADLLYREISGWTSSIQVQNLTQESKPTFVTVEFFDQSGDSILWVGDWICRNGATTFYLPAIVDLGVNFPFGYVGAAEIQSHQQVDYPSGNETDGQPIFAVVDIKKTRMYDERLPGWRHTVAGETQGGAYNAHPEVEKKNAWGWAMPFIAKEQEGATSRIAIRNNSNCNKINGSILIKDETGTVVATIPVPWLQPKHMKVFDLAYFEQITQGFLGAAEFWVWDVEQLCDKDGDGETDIEPVMPSVVVLNYGWENELEMPPGPVTTEGDLTRVYDGIPFYTAFSPCAIQVSGQVIDQLTLEPIEGASVNGYLTDSTGYYEFTTLLSADPLATVILTVSKSGYVTSAPVTKYPYCDDLVVNFELYPYCDAVLVAGWVEDKETGEPIEGAEVRADNWVDEGEAATNADGFYEIELAFDPDHVTWVTAYAQGYNGATDSVFIPNCGEAQISFQLHQTPRSRILLYYGNGGNDEDYDDAAALFESLGYLVDYTYVWPTDPDLEEYKVIFLLGPGNTAGDTANDDFTPSQVAQLDLFLRGGGRLVIMTEAGAAVIVENNLLNALNGSDVQFVAGSITSALADDITADQITGDVAALDFDAATSITVGAGAVPGQLGALNAPHPDAGAVILASDTPAGITRFGGVPAGFAGDVVLVGDLDWMDDASFMGYVTAGGYVWPDWPADNENLLLNLIGF